MASRSEEEGRAYAEGFTQGRAAEREEILAALPGFESIKGDDSDIHFNEALRRVRTLITSRSQPEGRELCPTDIGGGIGAQGCCEKCRLTKQMQIAHENSTGIGVGGVLISNCGNVACTCHTTN